MNFRIWREEAKAIIHDVIIQEGTDDLPALKKALYMAYPSDNMSYFQKKVWLQEVDHALTLLDPRIPIPAKAGKTGTKDRKQIHA